MPTLREFVDGVIAENQMQADAEAIIKQITDIARQRADGSGSVAISDEEIREMVVTHGELATKLAQEKKEQDAQREAEEQAQKQAEAERKAEEKKQKQLEKERKTAEGEQMSLFDL